jgi:predicted nucleic acid-binding protein
MNLTEHDAAYLDLALRTGLPLATLDSKIKQAVKLVEVGLVRI